MISNLRAGQRKVVRLLALSRGGVFYQRSLRSAEARAGAVSTSTRRSFATISSGLVSSWPFQILRRLQKPYFTEGHLA